MTISLRTVPDHESTAFSETPGTERSLHVCHSGLALFDFFTALPSTGLPKFGHELFSKILGVFVVWKKLVLVKRRAVDQRVCLSTIAQAEPAELTIQVNGASISFQSVL